MAARPGKRRAEIEGLCHRHQLPIRELDHGALSRRLGASVHNGFGAVHRASSIVSPEGDLALQVLLEDIQDPRNLGALVRVCEGAGVGRLWIRDRGSAPISSTVAKTSAGAVEWLPIERVVNSARQIEELKEQGFWIYGAAPEGVPPWELDLSGKVLLCLGGEGAGLRRRTLEACDARVGLPMRGRLESLNVATAASALLYEAVRQRQKR